MSLHYCSMNCGSFQPYHSFESYNSRQDVGLRQYFEQPSTILTIEKVLETTLQYHLILDSFKIWELYRLDENHLLTRKFYQIP